MGFFSSFFKPKETPLTLPPKRKNTISFEEIKQQEKTIEKEITYYHHRTSSLFVPAIAGLVVIITLVVFGQVQQSLNMAIFGGNVKNLLDLIPLLLVGIAIVTIVSTGLRIATN